MKMLKTISLVFLLIIFSCSYALALEVTTGSQESEGITDEAGNYLYGTVEAGDLVQIIHITSDPAVIHSPDNNGDPTGGDVLLATAKIGDGFPFSDPKGRFSTTNEVSVNNGWKIYCRAWNSTEATSSTYFGNSEIYTATANVGEQWDIHGSTNIPAFKTGNFIDTIPPSPPTNFKATQEVSGDLILTWTASASPDTVGTMLKFLTASHSPTIEGEGQFITNVLTTAAQSYRHTGLTDGTTYYYSAFAYDAAPNYSSPASTDEVSNDTLPPSVSSVSPASGESGVTTGRTIIVTFNDVMSQDATEAAFHIYPSVASISFSWSGGGAQMNVNHASFATGTYYTCTVDATAKDKGGNPLGSACTWRFRTAAGQPPEISDVKIDGWKQYPGDIISPHPKINATITDPDSGFAGIASIEIAANTISFIYGSPEIESIYSRISGYLDVRFPVFIPAGTYTIYVRAWDISGNVSEDAFPGLEIKGGAAGIIGPVLNYPNPLVSGVGTTFSYKLTIDANLEIHVYSIKGSKIYSKKIPSGSPGGSAGYNEFFWNGLSNFEEGIGNGIYIVKVVADGKVIGSSKIVIQN
jgi:hypothetical protein